jgi:spore coat protein U-like protein
MRYRLLITAALMLSPFTAGAQTASTSASVTVENYALSIVKGQDLSFGIITPSASINGGVSTTGGVTSIPNSGYGPASYIARGVPLAGFSITLPSAITLTSSRGSLTVDNFSRSGPTPISLDNIGESYFNVGATIQVGAGQLPGNYTGTFDVTVAYN